MSNYVKIFDTTLRDGEQSPGATMTSAEKLEVARSLADRIEAPVLGGIAVYLHGYMRAR